MKYFGGPVVFRLAVLCVSICFFSSAAYEQGPQQAAGSVSGPVLGYNGQSTSGSTPAYQAEGAAILSGTPQASSRSTLTPSITSLTITATFDASLTAPEIAVINTAITFYQRTITSPITVTMYFKDMKTGLGQSTTYIYNVSYQDFITALRASAASSDDTLAIGGGRLPTSTTNPVNGPTQIIGRGANLRALGFDTPPPAGHYDGVIGINTMITDVDGGQYSMLATVEHEMDEVLGLGSGLPSQSDPMLEDLFRYASAANSRSWSANASCTSPPQAFFSIDGTTHLDEFHNCTDGADYGDWVTHTPSQVQDAYGTPGSSPTLTAVSPEMRALDVIGYKIAKKRRAQVVSE